MKEELIRVLITMLPFVVGWLMGAYLMRRNLRDTATHQSSMEVLAHEELKDKLLQEEAAIAKRISNLLDIEQEMINERRTGDA